MSILRALADRYERQAAGGEAPAYGFSEEKISYAVVLDPVGRAIDTMDLRDTTGKKPRPKLRRVPRPVGRSSNIRPNFLWDKTAYALGVKRDGRTGSPVPTPREHEAFVALHRELLANAEDEGLLALLAFLESWRSDRYESLPHAEAMLDTNVVFRLDNGSGGLAFVHDGPTARDLWTEHLRGGGEDPQLCLVTGDYHPTAQVHPRIKGIRGAQTSGASIVSFNQKAFESFGKVQGANAPVSGRAAFAYTTALNALLARNSRNRVEIADATTVFWAEAGGDPDRADAAEDLFSTLIAAPPTDESEAAAVRDTIERVMAGKQLESVRPKVHPDTRFFVLGLAPNAARLSIRFWHEDTIGGMGERLRDHWRDLHLEPVPWRTPPAAWRLLRETAVQRKPENISPLLGGALMRAILRGGRYPRSLLSGVLLRIRSDGKINGLRAAICKACLARDHRLGHETEDVPVSLNPDEKNPAYRLGRLFALYERVQIDALEKVNTTIRDRFFGSASATPAAVFPVLARTAGHHLSALRKNKGELAGRYEREIDAVFDGLGTSFPRSLRLEDQGRFAIGYHHQRASRKGQPDDSSHDAQEG